MVFVGVKVGLPHWVGFSGDVFPRIPHRARTWYEQPVLVAIDKYHEHCVTNPIFLRMTG